MYTDFYLRFPSEAEANAVLYSVVDDETRPNYRNIDVLGVLYEHQEVADPENPPPPVTLPGWHVNVRVMEGEDAAVLETFAVVPEFPRRIWA